MKKISASMIFLMLAMVINAAILDIRTTEFKDFKVGEEIKFKVTAKADNGSLLKEGIFKIHLKYCGYSIADKPVEIDLSKGNPTFFTTKLDRPGFILAQPTPYKTADGKSHSWKYDIVTPSLGGAAVEPEKIRQAGTVPADFDKFWQDGVEKFKNAKITVTDNVQKRLGYKVLRVRVEFPDGSGAIEGFLSIPEGNGKFPAAVSIPGAGPGIMKASNILPSSPKMIELLMNIHPYPIPKTRAEMVKLYQEMNNKMSTKAYFYENAWDREKYVYRNAWLAISSAIDYVVKLPQFDGKNFAAIGHSQGGGTAIALGYLNKNITCVLASEPAFCDHYGYLKQRQPGWPLLNFRLKGRSDKTMGYFDAATFAAKLNVPTLVSVGYLDTICYPASVYAAYNNIKASKTIFPMNHGHSHTVQSYNLFAEFLKKQFSK